MSEQDDMCELEPVALAVELHSREVLALRRDEATPEEVTAARADASSVRAAIAQLTPLEQAFLQNHYFEQRSYSEFEFQSRKYSKSGLCRIHRQALKRLRRKLRWLDPSVSGAAI